MSTLQRWRLLVAWFGTGYCGWQRQANGLTVQEVLEQAVSRFFGGVPITARAAGRLDAGVHCRGQVVVVDVPTARSPQAWVRGLSHLLPDDVTCLGAAPCRPRFSPRYAATGKHYKYRWLERWPTCPFRQDRVWHIRRALQVERMNEAAQHLVGRHDYTTFRAAGCTASSPIRGIERIEVARRGDEVVLDVWGPAFLRHQVRIMAGTLVEVGRGRAEPGDMVGIMKARRRTAAGRTAPPEGLWLESVRYEPPLHWPETEP